MANTTPFEKIGGLPTQAESLEVSVEIGIGRDSVKRVSSIQTEKDQALIFLSQSNFEIFGSYIYSIWKYGQTKAQLTKLESTPRLNQQNYQKLISPMDSSNKLLDMFTIGASSKTAAGLKTLGAMGARSLNTAQIDA